MSTTTVPSFMFGGDFISIVLNNKPYTIYKNDARFERVKTILKNQDWENIEAALDTVKTISKFSNGNIEVFENTVTYKGKPINNVVVSRILDFISKDFPVNSLMNFLNKLMENPSQNSINQLYTFLESYKLPICDDGDFVAHKSVKNDFKDHHTGKISNAIGKTVKMDRNLIKDDPQSACGTGLHIGATEYVRGFSTGKCILVKVNPKNVVSVPHDCSAQKIRVCEYKVIGEVGENTKAANFEQNYAPEETQSKNIKAVSQFFGADKAYELVKQGKRVRSGSVTVSKLHPRSYFRKYKNWKLA